MQSSWKDKIFSSIDTLFINAERQFGKGIVSVFTGILFLLAAALVTDIRWETYHHGNGFTRLSIHPFDFSNPNDLRYRILSPLLGYLMYFRGPAFKYFMLFVTAVFLGMVYLFRRKENMRPSEALAITALFAFSTITFHQLYFPAYTDPTTFLLVLLLLVYYRSTIPATMLLILLIFNHENTFFLFPFFFLLMLERNYSLKNILGIALRFMIAILPYLAYRKFISMHVQIEYSVAYYFDPHNMQWTKEHVLPHLIPGVFQAFRLFWIFPLLAIYISFREKKFHQLFLMGVLMAGVLAQFLIAYDISRLAGMAFPVILLSAIRSRNYFGDQVFLPLITMVILLNFLIPSIYIGALEPLPLRPFWLK